MDEDPVAIVQRYLEAMSRLDPDGMIGELSNDVIFELPHAPQGIPRRLEGKPAVSEFLRHAMGGLWSDFKLTQLDIRSEVESGRVVAEYSSAGHMAATGQPYANTYVNLIRVRDGRIVATKEFFDVSALTSSIEPT